jgi:predicted nucleic acid-binding protein
VLVPDTNVVIAAALATHVHHDAAAVACAELKDLVEHVALEAYSVLTRLPLALRVDPPLAVATIAAHWPGARLRLPADAAALLPARLSDAQISGGAVYDGLILATSAHHGRTLLTLDRGVMATARRLSAPAELLR